MRRLSWLAPLLLAAGCGQAPLQARNPGEPGKGQPAAEAPAQPSPPPLQGGTDDWRAVATEEDEARVGRLAEAWDAALKEARAGFDAEVTRAGAALAPGAAAAGTIQPAPGEYGCRLYKLGSQTAGGLAFVTYPPFRCAVELTPGGDLVLAKITGSQRTRGLIYPDREDRGIFIGAQAWGNEAGWPAYGEMPERDQIGVVERLNERAWRVAFPFPRQESKLDVLVLEH